MNEIQKRDFIFARKKIIILIYILMVFARVLFAIITSRSSEVTFAYLVVLVVYGLLVALIYKGSKIANWIMIVLILLSGAASSLVGIALVPFDQLVFKTFLILSGLYFIYGGIKLIAIERTGQHGG